MAVQAHGITPRGDCESSRCVDVYGLDEALFARISVVLCKAEFICSVHKVPELPGRALGKKIMEIHYNLNEEMQQVLDADGRLVAEPRAVVGEDGLEQRVLWLAQGADLGLVICAALSFRKLS
eukprot:gnl/TRDRNA2_/TRDRNA2_168001_c1_seq1.p1 gnl/TRDRNA2_/TRDRNA2_168001_c1~~gnl/TRDRNA2_/TRDRNA2_168001_c1_seq1.p1  ORF type:complete len:133 (+),score=22.70 gnl/TRDRNA2_/TRDRNA2_168001_c1_seq1:32-400(+)